MSWSQSFSYVLGNDCRVLILGSMPGIKSLEATEYYAHPRNIFWDLIESLFDIPREESYKTRLDRLVQNKLGLWDVFSACYRPGSLDSDIRKKDAQINDFESLFSQYPSIKHVVFNGKAAEEAFRKSGLKERFPGIQYHAMPSTSPANASINFERKKAAWSKLKVYAVENT